MVVNGRVIGLLLLFLYLLSLLIVQRSHHVGVLWPSARYPLKQQDLFANAFCIVCFEELWVLSAHNSLVALSFPFLLLRL